MDIENIVEDIIMDEVGMTDTGYSRNINYIQIKDIASQISSDIKKELKLVASGVVGQGVTLNESWVDDGKELISFQKILMKLDKYNKKKVNIYVEEII